LGLNKADAGETEGKGFGKGSPVAGGCVETGRPGGRSPRRTKGRGARHAGRLFGVPGMGIDLARKVRCRLGSGNCQAMARESIARRNPKEAGAKMTARCARTAYKAI
jgi:hypothetical protein